MNKMKNTGDILKDYGWCQVIKRLDQYILNYDSGGVVVKMTELEISEQEAKIAIENEIETERIIRDKTK